MPKEKILLVEDDKMLSTIFSMFVKELGYEMLSTVNSGSLALKKCRGQKPDLIVMDIHIQGAIDGIETARRVLSEFELPVLFLSSDTDEETLSKAQRVESFGFIVKPVFRSTLCVAIKNALFKFATRGKLEKRRQTYAEYIETLDFPVVAATGETIEFANQKAIDLFENQDLVGKALKKRLVNFALQTKEPIQDFKQNERIQHGRVQINFPAGQTKESGVVFSVIPFEDKKCLQLALTDKKE